MGVVREIFESTGRRPAAVDQQEVEAAELADGPRHGIGGALRRREVRRDRGPADPPGGLGQSV
jgi:hypothetical protein